MDHPFAVHVAHRIPGLDRMAFTELLDRFSLDLFDMRTGDGSLILTNPGRLVNQSGITATVLASTWEDAVSKVRKMPERLRRMVTEPVRAGTTATKQAAIGRRCPEAGPIVLPNGGESLSQSGS